MAGTISVIENFFILSIRKPVATRINPPQALKSLIIDDSIHTEGILPERKNNSKKMIPCGIAIKETAVPREQAKIAAVKKSRIDFAINIVCSPAIPSIIAP
jgi:hypothetical protein